MPANRAITAAFADRLRHYRGKRGLTQAALATAAGLHWSYVERLEGGHKQPSFEVACRLADALEISVAKFRD